MRMWHRFVPGFRFRGVRETVTTTGCNRSLSVQALWPANSEPQNYWLETSLDTLLPLQIGPTNAREARESNRSGCGQDAP